MQGQRGGRAAELDDPAQNVDDMDREYDNYLAELEGMPLEEWAISNALPMGDQNVISVE